MILEVQYFDETPKLIRFYTDPLASDEEDDEGDDLMKDVENITPSISTGVQAHSLQEYEQKNYDPAQTHNDSKRSAMIIEHVVPEDWEMVPSDYQNNRGVFTAQKDQEYQPEVRGNSSRSHISPHSKLNF